MMISLYKIREIVFLSYRIYNKRQPDDWKQKIFFSLEKPKPEVF